MCFFLLHLLLLLQHFYINLLFCFSPFSLFSFHFLSRIERCTWSISFISNHNFSRLSLSHTHTSFVWYQAWLLVVCYNLVEIFDVIFFTVFLTFHLAVSLPRSSLVCRWAFSGVFFLLLLLLFIFFFSLKTERHVFTASNRHAYTNPIA